MDGSGKSPIVLLTDFGHHDVFAGVLKGVISSISPESKVMDLSHGVKPQDILEGSFFLYTSCAYFPKKTVFCVIIDPGVGSDRKALCIETQDYYFVGPDNGVLWEAAFANNIKTIIHLTNQTYFLDPVSKTFHGRDIFAPVAAHISNGLDDIATLGSPLKKCVEYTFPKIDKNAFSLSLTVIHIDRFGNLTLNLKEKGFVEFIQNRPFILTINSMQVKKVFSYYSEAAEGELFLIGSSSSFMEISLKNTSAAKKINAACLDRALLEVSDP